MRQIAALALLLVASSAIAAKDDSWLGPAPASIGTWPQWEQIPQGSFFEVPASKLPTAEAWLNDAPFLAQDRGGLSYFGHPEFQCSAAQMAYLIRAAYINGGTGEFQLFLAGSAIIVSHGSLGPYNPPSHTALVVCLPAAPTAVYSSLSTAL